MPIYEFCCEPCELRFEVLTTISRASETTCPECGSGEVKRVMSTFSSRTADGCGHSSHGGGCSGCASGNCGNCGCGH